MDIWHAILAVGLVICVIGWALAADRCGQGNGMARELTRKQRQLVVNALRSELANVRLALRKEERRRDLLDRAITSLQKRLAALSARGE
jgi:hypothetical protein